MNKRYIYLFIIAAVVVIIFALVSAKKGEVTEEVDQRATPNKEIIVREIEENSAGNSAAIANPASVFCEEKGGEIIIKDTPEGSVGYCVTLVGKICEEWNFFRSNGSKCTPPPEENGLILQ